MEFCIKKMADGVVRPETRYGGSRPATRAGPALASRRIYSNLALIYDPALQNTATRVVLVVQVGCYTVIVCVLMVVQVG